jgi:putative addiction module killer protein
LCELRINVSAGYRVYFIYRGKRVLLLLAGGDKSSQSADILKAKQLAKELK